MAQVSVTINGRVYRMGCDEGQEQVLIDLAQDIDRRIETFRQDFGEVGDMRLIIMAALEVGDELAEAHRQIKVLEAELAGLRESRSVAAEQVMAAQETIAGTLEDAAQRIERLTAALNGGSAAE